MVALSAKFITVSRRCIGVLYQDFQSPHRQSTFICFRKTVLRHHLSALTQLPSVVLAILSIERGGRALCLNRVIWIKETVDTSPNPISLKNVTAVNSPAGAIISGTNISADVANSTTSSTISLSVSPGASWKLYSDNDCTQEIANKTMILAVNTNTAYVKVSAPLTQLLFIQSKYLVAAIDVCQKSTKTHYHSIDFRLPS